MTHFLPLICGLKSSQLAVAFLPQMNNVLFHSNQYIDSYQGVKSKLSELWSEWQLRNHQIVCFLNFLFLLILDMSTSNNKRGERKIPWVYFSSTNYRLVRSVIDFHQWIYWYFWDVCGLLIGLCSVVLGERGWVGVVSLLKCYQALIFDYVSHAIFWGLF